MLHLIRTLALSFLLASPLLLVSGPAEAGTTLSGRDAVRAERRAAREAAREARRQARRERRQQRRAARRAARAAPELDPSAAGSVFVVIAGAGIVLLDRRRRRS